MPRASDVSPEKQQEIAWRGSSNIISPYLPPDEDAALAKEYWDGVEPANGPILFMESFLKIRNRTKDGALGEPIPFRLNRCQRIVYGIVQKLRKMRRPIRLIIPKARQVGVSTLIEGLIFTMCRLIPRSEARIISFENESARKIYDMSTLFYDELPEYLRVPLLSRTQDKLMFGNRDRNTRGQFPGLMSGVSIGTAKNVHVGRGSMYRALHLTEVAMWTKGPEVMKSILQCVPDEPDTITVIESSPMGAGGFFHAEFERFRRKMKRGEIPEFIPVFLPWWLHEEYELRLTPEEERDVAKDADDYERRLKERFSHITWGNIAWRRWAIGAKCQGDPEAFAQEYATTVDEAFASSGINVFEMGAVQHYIKNTMRNGVRGRIEVVGDVKRIPKFVEDEDGPVTLWKFPERGRKYSVGADGAMGKRDPQAGREEDSDSVVEDENRDSCAAVVLSDRYEQVAEFHSNAIDPYSFADMIAALARFYNEALVMVEVTPGGNAAGYGIQTRLMQIYGNIGRWKNPDRWDGMTKAHGYEVNAKTKSILVGMLQYEILHGAGKQYTKAPTKVQEHPRLVIRSSKLLSELTTFVRLKGGQAVGATYGAHDDLVIALAMALVAMEQMWVPVEESDQDRLIAELNRKGYNEGVLPGDDMRDHGWLYS